MGLKKEFNKKENVKLLLNLLKNDQKTRVRKLKNTKEFKNVILDIKNHFKENKWGLSFDIYCEMANCSSYRPDFAVAIKSLGFLIRWDDERNSTYIFKKDKR